MKLFNEFTQVKKDQPIIPFSKTRLVFSSMVSRIEEFMKVHSNIITVAIGIVMLTVGYQSFAQHDNLYKDLKIPQLEISSEVHTQVH